MARRLGEAFVDIRADASLFRASAITGMKKALAGVDAKIPVTAETARASAKIRAVLREIKAADPTIDLRVGTDLASAAMASFAARIKALSENASNLRVGIDDRAALAQIARLQIAIRSLTSSVGSKKFKITPESIAGTEAQVLALEAGYRRLADSIEKTADAERDAAAGAAFLAGMKPRIDALADRLAHMRADIDDRTVLAKIARINAALEAFRTKKVDISTAGFARAEAELIALEAALTTAGTGVGRVTDRLTRGRVAWFGWIGGILSAKVALFAGAREVGGFHLALDAIVETLAILVPALTVLTVGLGAFAAAAFLAQDTAGRIADHLKAVNTAATALNQTIPPLTDHFNKLAGVIRPQVFQLYGAAIEAANNQTGFLGQIAEKTGALLDRMAARLVVDLNTGGGGMRAFFKTGEEDLKQLGILFMNVGHIIAQLGRVAAQTHIAEFLIKGIATASQGLRILADFPVPLLAVVAALHGVYLWSGIATTLLVKMALSPVRSLANLAAGAERAGSAVASLGKDAGGATRIKAYLSDIGTGFSALPGRAKAFGVALKTLFTNPWTWAAIGAAAMVGLAVAFITARDATQQFVDSVNKAIDAATLFNVVNTTASSLVQVNRRLAQTQHQVNQEFDKSVGSATVAEGRYAGLAKTYGSTAQDANTLRTEQAKLGGQLLLESSRLSQVASLFGTDGLAGAMALATLAGVKVRDLLSSNEKVWATAIQQIQDLVAGYANMGQGSQQFASDLNVLTVAQSDQLKALDQLNGAYDTFTKIVGAPVTDFLTLDQAITRFNNDAKVAGARMSGLGGGIDVASKKVKSSSVQLQQDFQDVFNAAEQLFDAMRNSQAPADAQVAAIKHAVEALIPLAGTNKAAAAEISALAQEAGGPATTNLRQLGDWAGKTHDPLDKLYKDSQNAAIGFSNLSLDAQKLGTTLSQDLSKDMATAVENAIGLQGAMNEFAKDVRNGTDATASGHADRQKLYDDLVLVTGSGKQASTIIKAITDRLHGNADALSSTAGARKRFQDDVNKILDTVPKAKDDLDRYTKIVEGMAATADQRRAARQRLIDDLVRSGTSARDARKLVDDLQVSIDRMHGKQVTVITEAKGTGQISISGSGWAAGQGNIRFHAAQGAYINAGSGPTADDVPAMLSRGEVVVPASMVKRGAVDHLRGKLPGFRDGGFVGLENTINTSGDKAGSISGTLAGKAVRTGVLEALAAIKKLLSGSGQAVLAYAESFKGKVPYVWGGSTPAGWDCSGFVSYVYDHFKLLSARLDAAGLQRWAKPSAPTPGGMAFYGFPAHHVGFVVNGHTLLSALGHQWGTIESGLAMGDNSGYGIPPQGFGHGGTAAGNATPKGKLQELAFSLLAQYGWADQWASFNALETREAGWRMNATNPSSGAYGLAQFINGPSEYFQYGGDPNTALGQLTAMMNYIASRYGSPNAAWAHEAAQGWYSRGGIIGGRGFAPMGGYAGGGLAEMVKGYASGGTATFLDPKAAAWLGKYKSAQKQEYKDYVGFTQAFRKDLKHPKTGSYASRFRKTLLGELGTLDKRQRAEDAAYDAILHKGVSSKTVSHLRSMIREEETTAKDKALSFKGKGGHPGWLAGMVHWLNQINSLITHTPAVNLLPAGTVTEHVPGSVKDIHLGPVHTAPGGVLQFDKGGYLPPGITVAVNRTGKPEPVMPADAGGGGITVIVQNQGVIGSQQEMDTWLQNSMNRLARTGKLTQAVNTAARTR